MYMKSITLSLCFVIMATITFSQENIFYEEVVQTVDTTMTKNQIYSLANEWFALNFKSANDVLQLQDKESGKLIGKGYTQINVIVNKRGKTSSEGPMSFTFIVFCKDGRYKIIVSNVLYYGYPSSINGNGYDIKSEKPSFVPMMMFLGYWLKIKAGGYNEIDKMVNDLKNFINKNKSSNW